MNKRNFRIILAFLAFMQATALMAQCPTISCPGNINVVSDSGICGAIVSYVTPVGKDTCGSITETFNYTGSIVNWNVPAGITSITIEAKGAQGGYNTSSAIGSGLGASMKGDFSVTPGETLKILVGQQPSVSGGNGGGGGTFVTDISNNPLIVAGGGGGSAGSTDSPDKHGQITTSGGAGAAGGGAGGVGGNGGSVGSSGFQAGAGGGLITDGTNGWTSNTAGLAFINGGAGGSTNAPANGGFGGGGSGSAYVVGGGGGGFSGGGSGGNSTAGVGGGGGSYNGGANQVNNSGVNTGNGIVTITYTAPHIITTTLTSGFASDSLFPLGLTYVSYKVANELGDTNTCTFTVTVTDDQNPVPDSISLPTLTDICAVTVNSFPTATDNCTGPITATTTDSLNYYTPGSYQVNWLFSDGNGNTTTQIQNILITGVDTAVSVTATSMTANAAGATYAWLNCDYDTIITGETNQSLIVPADGNYALVITQGGCTDTSACYSFLTTGTAMNNNEPLISVWPNPATASVTVGTGNLTDGYIQLSDITGRIIFTQSIQQAFTTIDLSAYERGIFFIIIETPDFRKVNKLVRN